MKRLALLLPLLALAAGGCRKTTFTPDVVPASIQSYHQDPDGRLTLKIKCDSATAKGRAFLCSTKPAKGKGEPLASVRFQFYERGNIPGSEQLTLDADGTTEYSVDIDKLNAALAGIPEQARPADRILHVFINQTEVGQWNLESLPATEDPAAAFAADRARVGAKLESLRLDAFEYAGADAVAAFTLLMDKARQADADEPDPLKKGVPMVLDVAPGDAFPAIDVSLHDVSLRDALDALSGPFGLEWMVCGSVVKAGLRGKLLRPLEHRLAKIRAEAEVPADDAGWKELLGKAGVEWPAGSYVKFLPSVRRLVLMNTEEELAKAERALADLGLAAPSPASSEPRAENAETAAPRPGEAGPLLEGAAERSEAGGVPHAESAEGAEYEPHAESAGH